MAKRSIDEILDYSLPENVTKWTLKLLFFSLLHHSKSEISQVHLGKQSGT